MGAVLLKPHAPVDRWREELVLLGQDVARKDAALRMCRAWIDHWIEDAQCGLVPTISSLSECRQAIKDALAGPASETRATEAPIHLTTRGA